MYQLYDVAYGCMMLRIKTEKMVRMDEGSNYFDLIVSVDTVSTSSVSILNNLMLVHLVLVVLGGSLYQDFFWFDVVILFDMGSHLCFLICCCC